MNVKVSYIFRFISMLYTDSMHGERACKIWGPVLVKITLIKFIKSELIKLFVQLFLWYFTNNYIYSSNYFYVF